VKAILLAAVAVLSIGVSCADARAPDTTTATGTDSGSTSVSASGLPTPPPSRSIGGVGIRVWTPVAPPYNAEANGDLAARNIWGSSTLPQPTSNSAVSSSTPTRDELPMRAIVHGHNVQPRGYRLNALGYSDLTSQQAQEVDRLYQQLMQNNVGANRKPS
jgi:hypothetical protein